MTASNSFCMFILFFILVSCRENETRQNMNQEESTYNDSSESSVFSAGEVILNNVPTRTILLVDPDMTTELPRGSRINIVEYLKRMGFSSEARKMKIETGEEILFLRYFTGGAHCCQEYEAFRYDERADAFRYIDQFSCEECDGALIYPIAYQEWMDYFYCSFAGGKKIECPKSGYNTSMHLINDVFTARVKGDIKAMEECFIDYCRRETIPELKSDGDDNGEREGVLNHLYSIWTLHSDMEKVKKLYYNHFPDLRDKDPLWNEMQRFILSNGIPIDHTHR